MNDAPHLKEYESMSLPTSTGPKEDGAGLGFLIHTSVYSGPLDLLIDLIEKRKLLINDISLAKVTDDYLRYVSFLKDRNMRETADFIVFAATLLLLKSRSLLPVLELTESEEESVEALELRLRYYQIFKHAGMTLYSLYGKAPQYGRRLQSSLNPIFMPDKWTTLDSLHRAIHSCLKMLPEEKQLPRVKVKTVVSLEEMLARLEERIQKSQTCYLSEVTKGTKERAIVIVGFLAVLEMVKRGRIIVTQRGRCEDIAIEGEYMNIPSYG